MPVSGSSTHARFSKLIDLGEKRLCSRTNTYYHISEMNPDGKGGWIAKSHDNTLHDEYIEKSKFGNGPHSQRGIIGGL